MQYFYSNQINEKIIILDKVESNHCLNVLRNSLGDKINVVDGRGNLYIGKIIKASKQQCEVSIIKDYKNYNKKTYYVHIAISIIKNSDRMEWFVEKAVEIGVDEISFIRCNRTMNKKINFTRINKVAITAMKQSLKAYCPRINEPVSFENFLKSYKNDLGFICHLNKNNKKTLLYNKIHFKNKNSFVMIGPEGDFDKKELTLAKKYNIQSVSLGESRLRTETAGIVACHLVNLVYE